jgi:hypothetical protein
MPINPDIFLDYVSFFRKIEKSQILTVESSEAETI